MLVVPMLRHMEGQYQYQTPCSQRQHTTLRVEHPRNSEQRKLYLATQRTAATVRFTALVATEMVE